MMKSFAGVFAAKRGECAVKTEDEGENAVCLFKISWLRSQKGIKKG